MQEKDAGVNEVAVVNKENTTNMDDEVSEVVEPSKSMSFRQRMRGGEPYHLPLKNRLKDKMVPYRELFRPGPPPSRRNDDTSNDETEVDMIEKGSTSNLIWKSLDNFVL